MSWCSIAMKLWLPEGTYPESFEKKKRTNRFSVRPQLLFGSRITIHHKTGSWAILPGTLWGGKTPRKTRRKTNESIIFDIYIYIYISRERDIYIYIQYSSYLHVQCSRIPDFCLENLELDQLAHHYIEENDEKETQHLNLLLFHVLQNDYHI